MNRTLASLGFLVLSCAQAHGQSVSNVDAIKGLMSVTTLERSDAGKAALAMNFKVTGEIQDGAARQPTLLPWPEQQQLALRDAFITWDNASELADGLGAKLGQVYQARASCVAKTDGKGAECTNISPAIATVIAYAVATSGSDSSMGKYIFANATTNGETPAPPEIQAILTEAGGVTDFYGRAYGRPAGSDGADPHGDSRPFQTEPNLTPITGPDFFGVPSSSTAYLRGPAQNLTASPAYPSGHTTYGYTESLLLALMVPDRYSRMVVRAAEYGNDRIVLGAHYAMDVVGGRTLALYDLAHLLANTPGYVGVERGAVRIDDFRKALAEARADLTRALESGCGASIAVCARQDDGRFADPARDMAFYDSTQTYGLGVVYSRHAKGTEDVAKLAPEAGYLLTVAFPSLSLRQADAILTSTEGPGGGFLDNGSGFGVYSRLNLYAAALKARAKVR